MDIILQYIWSLFITCRTRAGIVFETTLYVCKYFLYAYIHLLWGLWGNSL